MRPMKTLVTLVIAAVLAGCGGGAPVTPESAAEQHQYSRSTCYGTPGIRECARQDYVDALYIDAVREQEGRLESWRGRRPIVVIPGDAGSVGEAVVRRAVAIINRSFPEYGHLRIEKRRNVRMPSEQSRNSGQWWSEVQRGTIVAGYGAARTHGVANVVNQRGYAVVDPGVTDYTSDGIEEDVTTMVHEFVHALGVMGHPHHVHTSILSYEHDFGQGTSALPLIDASILNAHHGFGWWNELTQWTTSSAGPVRYGARVIDGTHIIPFVDAATVWRPPRAELTGTARFDGEFLGHHGPYRSAYGHVRINVNFGRDDGDIRFHNFQTTGRTQPWSQARRERWDFSYALAIAEHWFESTEAGSDGPDVTGSFYSKYGHDVDVAAGTLERGTLIGGFGATKD